jgi:phosphohistidine phosphatase
MKILYILRHAKSDWKFEELSDHDRPLNGRGRTDAPLMGSELASRGVILNRIISSSAVRALTTATLIAKELDYNPNEIVVDDRIYGADKNLLLEIVQTTPKEMKTIMLVGHNEALSDFANTLSPKSIGSLPTTGVVALDFKCDNWREISQKNAKLLFFDFPKNHK